MSTQVELPKSLRPHLDEIARRLWGGHAAVLVGAGFSQNAVPLSGASRMPSWKDLANVLQSRLYPDRGTCVSEGDTLGLADEYTAIFGAGALDRLLMEVIDDSAFAPGELHSRLIELPWTEVLTTNYDTLLERTAETVISRKYDIVTRVDDLPLSRRPRIVKLHGSFPECTPFIISGEQYRRYPLDGAPFVNTVQQAIMENVLCLLGFSGYDPNFERWIGWVRDYLGNSMPYVYLVGHLILSESKRQAFLHKRIIPVDLSVIEGVTGPQMALCLFFDYLERGRPKAPEEWSPKTGNPPAQGKASSDDIVKVVDLWRDQRRSYPGWAVAPTSKRRTIWHSTEYWIPTILAATIPSPDDLFAAFELDWRMSRSLVHPIPELLEWIERTVTRYHPFHKQAPEELLSGSTSRSSPPWKAMSDCWVELVFTIAKRYRLKLVKQKFDHWMESVLQKDILSQSPEWVAKWYYEKCMYCIADLDSDALRRTVEEWPTIKELPFYEIKKGGIYIELGEYERAEKTIRDAINELRRRTNLTSVMYDLTDLSQESVALLSLQLIQNDPFPDEASLSDRPEFERRKVLRRYECDPLKELMSIRQSLASATEKSADDTAHRITFDGRHHYSHTVFGGFPDEVRYALEFSNFFEESGLPFRGKLCALADKDTVRKTSGIVAEEASPWALACIVRSGNVEALDQIFSRTSVARMSQEDIDATLAHYIAILTRSIEKLQPDRDALIGRTLRTQLCRVLPDVISRLVIRSSHHMQDRVCTLGTQLWGKHNDVIHFVLQDSVRILFERLLQSADTDQCLRWMPSFLSLRPANKAYGLARQYKGEPLLSIQWPDDYVLPRTFDRASWGRPIRYLLDLVESGDDLERAAATIRLGQLYQIGALSPEEEQHLRNGVWKEGRVDQVTGLPLNTGYHDGALLRLPHPNNIDLQCRIKLELLAGEFPREEGNSISITDGKVQLVQELLAATPGVLLSDNARKRYVRWTTDEVLQILDKIIEWWDSDKARLLGPDEPYFSTKEEFLARFMNIPTLLSHIILPKLDTDAPEVCKQRISRLLGELSDNNVPCLRARAAALTVFPSAAGDLASAVVKGLASQESSHAQDACVAVAVWGISARQYQVPQLPEHIQQSLFDIIYLRRLPTLHAALRESVVLFEQDLIHDAGGRILVGLEYMLDETSLASRTSAIRREERPEYRQQAARLSWAIHVHCQRHNLAVPDAIHQWRHIAQNDPLPEVRRAWPRVN